MKWNVALVSAVVLAVGLVVTFAATGLIYLYVGLEPKRLPQSVEQVSAEVSQPDLEYKVLRRWHPNDAKANLGIDVELQEVYSESTLVDVIHSTMAGHPIAIVKVYLPGNDLVAVAVKNETSSGLYRGANEIRWMQETGEYGHLYGTVTTLRN